MKPASFNYHSPETLEEVVALLAQHGSDARCMAGGQSLVPLMNLRMARPAVLIDLNRCQDLVSIERGSAAVTYGSMVRQRSAQLSETTTAYCPLVTKALAHAGPVAVRNRATIGGTLAHADRSAELPGVAMALDAVFVLASSAGERNVAAVDFFIGDLTTAIEPKEVLRAIQFPVAAGAVYAEFLEVGVRREGVAIVGLAAQVTLDEGSVVAEVRLAVTGIEPQPVRLRAVEQLLRGQKLGPDLVAAAEDLASACVDPMDDPFVPSRYRRRVAGALVRQALDGASGVPRH